MKKLYLLFPLLLFVFITCEEEQDTTPPTVSISSPVSGQTVNDVVTITVITEDNEEISKVEFFIDDNQVFSDISHPFQYDWNTRDYDNNTEYIIKVISYDSSDNSTISTPITLTVYNWVKFITTYEFGGEEYGRGVKESNQGYVVGVQTYSNLC